MHTFWIFFLIFVLDLIIGLAVIHSRSCFWFCRVVDESERSFALSISAFVMNLIGLCYFYYSLVWHYNGFSVLLCPLSNKQTNIGLCHIYVILLHYECMNYQCRNYCTGSLI